MENTVMEERPTFSDAKGGWYALFAALFCFTLPPLGVAMFIFWIFKWNKNKAEWEQRQTERRHQEQLDAIKEATA